MGMPIEDIRRLFTYIVEIFPGVTLQSLTIEQEDGQMAFLKMTKDDVKEQVEFTLIPAGKYTAMIMNHEWKETKNGHMLALTFEITGPENVGRKVFENYNLDNPSEQTVQIAMGAMKALCLAADAESFLDAMFEAESLTDFEYLMEQNLAEALYNRNIEISVGVEKSKDPQYSDKNKVKGYAAVTAPVINKPAGRGSAPAWGKAKAA